MLVERSGNPIGKSALDSAWQRFITEAMRVGVITESERFALHGLKHRGITDSENKASGGHKSEAMRQLYDHEARETTAQALNFPGNFPGDTKKAPIGRLSC